MFLDNKETTARELISAIRKTFAGPQDSTIADKLLVIVQRDLIAEAANRRADQFQALATELEPRIAELEPIVSQARAEHEEAQTAKEKAELSFMQSYANAQGVGAGVPTALFEGRSMVQEKYQTAQGRLRQVSDELTNLKRRRHALLSLAADLRTISPAQPGELRAIIENSKLWRG